MRNDVNIKTTLVVKDNINEIYFDFHNDEGKYVGNITVSEQGSISWSIMDLMYEENIISVVDFIMGNKDRKLLHYESKELDPKRWDNAKIYIATHNGVLNYSQDDYLARENMKTSGR